MANDGGVTLLHEVAERMLPVARLEPVIGRERYERLLTVAGRVRTRLADRTIWNVSSVAVGGGVAEMLQVMVGYVSGADIAIRWTIIGGDPEFFGITKRLHNQIHGAEGEDGPLGSADARYYEQVLAPNADELLTQVRPGDIVILHDPQTAGLTAALARAGCRVIWRCHIGIDHQNDISRAAWDFLRPYLSAAHGYVFTRRQYAPLWVPRARTWIIPPSIDPFSAKNAELGPESVRAILTTVGIYDGDGSAGPASYLRGDGTRGEVSRPGLVMGDGRPGPDDPVVVQVSRWDRLKDMAGVMSGFADYVLPDGNPYLLLVGPSMSGVADDPEGAMVFAECLAQWNQLPPNARERVLLVTLPLVDVEENAAMVNAIQRRANGDRAEEPGRRLRADRRRGHVEGPPGGRLSRGRHRRPGRRGHRHPAAGSVRSGDVRRAGPVAARPSPGGGADGGRGQGLHQGALPRRCPPAQVRRARRSDRRLADGPQLREPGEWGGGQGLGACSGWLKRSIMIDWPRKLGFLRTRRSMLDADSV